MSELSSVTCKYYEKDESDGVNYIKRKSFSNPSEFYEWELRHSGDVVVTQVDGL